MEEKIQEWSKFLTGYLNCLNEGRVDTLFQLIFLNQDWQSAGPVLVWTTQCISALSGFFLLSHGESKRCFLPLSQGSLHCGEEQGSFPHKEGRRQTLS